MDKSRPASPPPSHALYQALTTAYDHFNMTLFDSLLPQVIFTVQRQKDLLGYFAPERWTSPNGERCHELAINPTHMGQSRVIEVLQTLVHEMVHCWQHCHGEPGRSSYHNKEWAYKMIEIGLQPSSTGLPGGKITGQHMSDYPIENGQFLLACHSLVKDKSFSLPWIYRMKARSGDLNEWIGINEQIAHENTNTLKVEGLPEKIREEQISFLEATEPEAFLYSTYSDLMPDDTFFVPAATKTKKKTTYQCPNCLTKIWGKPDLNLACLDCNCAFNIL